MNIQSSAMADPTYVNPSVSGDLTGVNLAVWLSRCRFGPLEWL